ncbi:cytochrome b [Rhodoferax sp.]|uniref:cytochrome b n=1 Tax=Rhodoferax sp. TaxID=50421 RepID=UPI00374D6314
MPTSTPWLRPDSATRYGSVSRLFHWTMAFCFALMFAAALAHFFAKDTPVYELLWPLHRPTGTLLMLLVVLRAAWALLHASQRPPHLSQAARLGHLALYALMLAVPCIGLLRQYGSARGFAPWGIPLMEARGEKIEWMTDLGRLLHGKLGWVLLACVLGHVAMALWHRRSGDTNVLPRMIGSGEAN